MRIIIISFISCLFLIASTVNSAEKKLKTKSFAKYLCKDEKTKSSTLGLCKIFKDKELTKAFDNLSRAKLVYVLKFVENTEYGKVAEVRYCSDIVQGIPFMRDPCYKESKKTKSKKFGEHISIGYVPKDHLKSLKKKELKRFGLK